MFNVHYVGCVQEVDYYIIFHWPKKSLLLEYLSICNDVHIALLNKQSELFNLGLFNTSEHHVLLQVYINYHG